MPFKRPRIFLSLVFLALSLLAGAAFYWQAAPARAERRWQKSSLDQLQAAARRDPNNPQIYYYLGLHWQALGQASQAQSAYARAVTLDPAGFPAMAQALHQKQFLRKVSTEQVIQDASALLTRNDLDKAERGFNAVLKRDPNSAPAYYSLGLILDERGETDEAFRAYGRATKLRPKLLEARYQMALLYYRTGFPDEAERRMKPLVQEAPYVSRYWYGLGNCVKDDEARNMDALEDFRRAYTLDPQSGECALALAEAEAKMHQDATAEQDYRKALALSPGDPSPALALGLFLLDRHLSPDGQAEAVHLLQTALTLSPHDPAILTGLGQAALNQGNPSDAVARLEDAEAHSPSDPKIWYLLGTAYKQLGNAKRADYCRTASTSLSDYIARLSFAEDQARTKIGDPLLRLRLARLYAQGGQYARAINQYQMCQHLDPANTAALKELAALTKHLEASGQMPSMSAFNGMMIASVKNRPR